MGQRGSKVNQGKIAVFARDPWTGQRGSQVGTGHQGSKVLRGLGVNPEMTVLKESPVQMADRELKDIR